MPGSPQILETLGVTLGRRDPDRPQDRVAPLAQEASPCLGQWLRVPLRFQPPNCLQRPQRALQSQPEGCA